MEEKIGNVVLKYDAYKGEDFYTDGNIEDHILDICSKGNVTEALYNSNEWAVLYHLSSIRENIIEWYPIKSNETVLEIGSGCGAISGVLCKKAKKVIGIDLSKKRSMINAYKNSSCSNFEIMVGNFEDIRIEEKFDYVTLIGVLEYSGLYIHSESPYEEMLCKAKGYLKDNGKLIIAIENKMGLKYLNGANEDHTSRRGSGINDYINVKNVRTFSKPELCELLKKAGIEKYQFFYPTPDYKLPAEVYTDEALPVAGDIRYYQTNYDQDRMFFCNEAIAFDQVCRDRQYDYFSNSFLVVCNEDKCDVQYVKYNRERINKFRLKTIVREFDGKKIVEKMSLEKKADEHIMKIYTNYQKINNLYKNVEVLMGTYEENIFFYPYVEGTNLDATLFELRHNTEKFIETTKEYILKYYEHDISKERLFVMTDEFKSIFGNKAPEKSTCLNVTNIDHLFHNMRIGNGQVYLFDYEWVFDFPIPHEFVIWRCVSQLYGKYRMYLSSQVSYSDFICSVEISKDNFEIYENMDKCFTEYVTGKNQIEQYTKRYKKKAYMQTLQTLY